MTIEARDGSDRRRAPALDFLLRKNVVAGLAFMAVAVLGLWLSRNYPIGTAVRMGTGYVPRLLCWILLLLGGVVFALGALGGDSLRSEPGARIRPLILVPASIVAFGVSIERFGLVVATLLLVGVASLAGRELRPVETAITAVVLCVLLVTIFVWGLGMPLMIWPER